MMKKLIETIVKPLVDHPEHVRIGVEERQGRLVCSLSLHPEDMGKVIGKQGRVASAIRTVVNSAEGASRKRVRVDIMD